MPAACKKACSDQVESEAVQIATTHRAPTNPQCHSDPVSEPSKQSDFYGVLGRVTINAGDAELRFYPFVFSPETDAKCVFVVKFELADFDEAKVTPRIGQELDVTILPNRAELFDPHEDEVPTRLGAASVVATWGAYDHRDLVEHTVKLTEEFDRLNAAFCKGQEKDRRGLAITQELMRRAEIKSAASEDQKIRQAAAIAVLGRLLTHFEGGDV
jgi:hypothetical protein